MEHYSIGDMNFDLLSSDNTSSKTPLNVACNYGLTQLINDSTQNHNFKKYLKKENDFQRPAQEKSYQNPEHVHLERISKSKKKKLINQEIQAAYCNNVFNKYTGDQRMNWITINKLTSRKSNKTLLNEEK